MTLAEDGYEEDEWSKIIVWGQNRVFVSPAPGCPAKCSFCYLPIANANVPLNPKFAASEILHRVTSDENFRLGPNGTIISIGCLSEPLAPHAVVSTIEFLEVCAGITNPIQLATRWVLKSSSLERFTEAVKRVSLVLFHSLSTISEAKIVEAGTPSFHQRREFIDACHQRSLRSCLYIKPFLPGITIHSCELFVRLAFDVSIHFAVVGPLYRYDQISRNLSRQGSTASESDFVTREFPVGFNQELASLEVNGEVRHVVKYLSSAGIEVFSHSWQLVRYLRLGDENGIYSGLGN